MINFIRLPESACPGCKKKLDSATNLMDGEGIDPGDYSVCICCGTFLRYDEKLHVRRATKADLKYLESQDISAYLRLMHAATVVRETH